MSVMMITLSGCQTSAKTGGFTSYDEHYQKNETALKEDALSDRWESRGSKVAVVSKEKADNNDYPEAKEVLLVNNTKNKVIVSQKVFDQAYPASTTKIMTALLTLENLNLSQVVTIKRSTCRVSLVKNLLTNDHFILCIINQQNFLGFWIVVIIRLFFGYNRYLRTSGFPTVTQCIFF